MNSSKDHAPEFVGSFDGWPVGITAEALVLRNSSGCMSMESMASVSMHMIAEETATISSFLAIGISAGLAPNK